VVIQKNQTDRQKERQKKKLNKKKKKLDSWMSDDFSMDKTFLLLFKTSYLSVRIG